MVTKAILLLISLGLGYLVILFSKREKGVLRTIGYCLGAFIIAVSIIFALRNLWQYISVCGITTAQPAETQYELPKP